MNINEFQLHQGEAATRCLNDENPNTKPGSNNKKKATANSQIFVYRVEVTLLAGSPAEKPVFVDVDYNRT